MEDLSIKIIKGKDLSEKIIKFMEDARIKEYGGIYKDFRKDEQNSIFFYVKNRDEILSFGMLKPIKIEYLGEKFEILGIGAIMSIKKGRGYGKVLIKEILGYLKLNKKTGLGFCGKQNSKFYEKCGFDIIDDMALRFRYRFATPEEEQAELDDGGDGICFNGEDNFIKRVVETRDLVYMDIPFW